MFKNFAIIPTFCYLMRLDTYFISKLRFTEEEANVKKSTPIRPLQALPIQDAISETLTLYPKEIRVTKEEAVVRKYRTLPELSTLYPK